MYSPAVLSVYKVDISKLDSTPQTADPLKHPTCLPVPHHVVNAALENLSLCVFSPQTFGRHHGVPETRN